MGLDTAIDTSEDKNSTDGANKDLFEEKPGIDHFKNEENDPKNTNAMSKLSSILFVLLVYIHYCHICLLLFPLHLIAILYFWSNYHLLNEILSLFCSETMS